MKITGNDTWINFEVERPEDQIVLRQFGRHFGHYCGSWLDDKNTRMGIQVSTKKLLEIVNATEIPHEQEVRKDFILCRKKDGTFEEVLLKDGETAQAAYDAFHAADITEGPQQPFFMSVADAERKYGVAG